MNSIVLSFEAYSSWAVYIRMEDDTTIRAILQQQQQKNLILRKEMHTIHYLPTSKK